jgi:hypothetical protein
MTVTVAAPADALGAGGAGATVVEVVVPRASTPSVHHTPAPHHTPQGLPFTGSPILLFLLLAALLLAAGGYLRRVTA